MDLTQALREQVRSYVDGRSSIAALRGWLGDHVQEIADSGDPHANALDGLAWILISELDYGHRDEASIRVELQHALETSESAVIPTLS